MNGNGNDASGNGHNGAIQSVATTTDRAGQAGQALAFDAVSSSFTVPDAAPLRLASSDFTIAVWVYETNRNASYQDCLISKRGSANADGWFLGITGQLDPEAVLGHLFYQVSGGNDPYVASTTAVPLNQWHHLAVVYSNSTQNLQMYIDGVPNGAANLPAPNATTTNAMTIGNDSGGYIFNGKLDDLRIYSRALASSEVLALFNGGLAFTSLQARGGWFAATLAGVSPGETAVFQSSTDAVTWTPIQTNTAGGLTLYFTHQASANPTLFFRAVEP